MTLADRDVRGVLAVVASAAGGVEQMRTELVEPAVAAGWRVAVTLTPTAGAWLRANGETARIERATGLPVRDSSRLPGEPRPHPDPDCVIVAPATANTVAKLALGNADSQALTLAGEALGIPDLPVVVFPLVNAAHARHPAWPGHLAALRAAHAHLVYGPEVWPHPEPRSRSWGHPLPWAAVLAAAERLTDPGPPPRPARR